MTIIDLFAGGGGASHGIEMALGESPLLAVNHSEHAIAMHRLNHPSTRHLREDVWAVDPWAEIPRRLRRKIKLLWASPDCKHFSIARGGKPVDKKIRLLPMVVVRWAREIRPDVLMLENVREMRTWGPLYPEDHPNKTLRNKPIPERKGETWELFLARLQLLGYRVEHRVLNCADYGAPTSRKRLFLIARCDGKPIVWPTPSHGPDRPQPWRTAAEHLDWNLPCPSIFLTKEEAKAWGKQHGCRPPKRPLADNTMKRIAAGVKKFVLDAQKPFLLNYTHGGRLEPVDAPLRTITGANRGEKGVVVPSVVRIGQTGGNGTYTNPVTKPLTTITTKNEHLLVSPHLVQVGYGERAGQAPRVLDIEKPLGTVTAHGNKFAMAAAFLSKHFTGAVGQDVEKPLGTITAIDHHSLAAVHLTKFYGTSTGSPAEQPLPTVTSGGQHIGCVAAFLQKYYGQGIGQDLREPLHTIPTLDRFGLVTVQIGGEPWAIVDIGVRMLTPRELASCQGFPQSYQLIGSKKEQVHRVGNSVPPQAVAALVRANLIDHPQQAAA